MKALVIGGTGRVGGAVVEHLRACGADTVVAARRPPEGGLALDLRDPAQVEARASGFSHAFFATPLGPDEGRSALPPSRRSDAPASASWCTSAS